MRAQSCWEQRHEGARGAGAGGFCPCIPALGANLGAKLPIGFGCFGPKEEEKWLRRGTCVLKGGGWLQVRAPEVNVAGIALQPAR